MIALANRLKNEINDAHFVPVYWMGSEDHDLEELNHIHFSSRAKMENGLKGPVSRMPLKRLLQYLIKFWSDWATNQRLKS